MSEYIKREDAIKEVNTWSMFGNDNLESRLNRLPSADVVEVVRCKDCKYYKEYISYRGSAMMCFCPCCFGGQGIKTPDDYCSYGERKEQTDGCSRDI